MSDVTFTPALLPQAFTVPTQGDYQITSIGGDGGDAYNLLTAEVSYGLQGAVVKGDFLLNAGDLIWVVPGSAGCTFPCVSGGGGGSFVYDATTAMLLEAASGGGGGVSFLCGDEPAVYTVGGGDWLAGGSYVDPSATEASVTAASTPEAPGSAPGQGSVAFDLLSAAACYVGGTRLATPRGLVAIECLAAGDLVLTASGAARPIIWLGRRRIDTAAHPNPKAVWPYLVTVGAFGDALPCRDLWLSPGHNIVAGGALVPISALANGRSIRQVRRPVVEYWHIELESHDIVIAENLPAESYLDTGNRHVFENAGTSITLHPDLRPRHWADTCLPLVFGGDLVRDARCALVRRLMEAGHAITSEDDAHIMAGGVRIDPVPLGGNRRAFLLPPDVGAAVLHTRFFIPTHVDPSSGDGRELGICVGSLQLDGLVIDLADDEYFREGWHRLETPRPDCRQRWTKPAVPLQAGTRLVVIECAARGYYWAPWQDEAAALFR